MGFGDLTANIQTQSKAADQLRHAAESLRDSREQDKPRKDSRPPGQQQNSDHDQQDAAQAAESNPSSTASAPPRDARDLTAAQILEKERRDRELLNRLRRAAIGRLRPVDKDW